MARERDRILGTVSDEMRQALAAALAAQHVLVERSSDPAAPRAATVLERQLRHLAKLVELLLDYSHLTVGNSALATEPLDVREVVRETVEACQADAIAAGIEFSESLWHSPRWIGGDPTRLRQLVSNIVHNGLRYTAARGRVVCATMTRDNAVEIIVSDTGIGIAAEDRSALGARISFTDVTPLKTLQDELTQRSRSSKPRTRSFSPRTKSCRR
jgi:signal transduction histidine kinase